MAAWLLPVLFAAAAPQCTVPTPVYTPIYAGIDSATVTVTCTEGGQSFASTAHIVRVALDTPELEFVVSDGTPDALPLELPTHFLRRTGSRIAFNANLFVTCCTYANPHARTDLRGLAMANGVVLAPEGNDPEPDHKGFPFDTSLVEDHGKLAIMKSSEVGATAASVVTGSHALVANGANVAPVSPDSGEFFGRNSRTMVGLSADGRTFWVVAVDVGSTSKGVHLPEGAQVMIALGAGAAINLDGGGSTSLAFDDNGKPGLLNQPNDGGTPCDFPWPAGQSITCERYVGISFGIRAPALNGAGSIR